MSKEFDLHTDIILALSQYPLLQMKGGDEGKLWISGEIELCHAESRQLIDTFSVDIHYPDDFPYRFPKVFETGGKIEKIVERHINTIDNNSLCLVVPPEERLLCRYGISTLWFLDNVLYPRLAEEFLVNNGGKYQREYSHGGANGNWEFYSRTFNLTNQELILKLLNTIVTNSMPVGHDPCVCGSGIKFKKCHLKSMVEVSTLGNPYLAMEIRHLSTNWYSGKKM